MQFLNFHHHKKNEPLGIYNLELFESPPDRPFSVGIHPKNALENKSDLIFWFKETSQHPNCLAIGECGLDGIINVADQLQKELFLEQITWANHIQKPVIIHCVRRYSEIIQYKKLAKTPMIIHGFSKKNSVANILLQKQFYLSFGKALVHNISLQKIWENISLEFVFLETDTSEFEIQELYNFAAHIKGITTQELVEKINLNLKKVLYESKMVGTDRTFG